MLFYQIWQKIEMYPFNYGYLSAFISFVYEF